MVPQITAALVLLAVFVIGTTRGVSLGALALSGAILVGPLLLGGTYEDALAGFPVDLFILILGVTYLFAIATVNGTVAAIVNRCTRLLGDRPASLPPLLFVLAAVPTSLARWLRPRSGCSPRSRSSWGGGTGSGRA